MTKTVLFFVFVLFFFVSSSSCFQFPSSHHHEDHYDGGSNCFSCREENKRTLGLSSSSSQSTSSPVSRFEIKTMSSTEPSMMGSSSRSSVSRDHAVSSSSSSLPWLPETSSNSRMSSLLQPLSSRNAFFETAAQLEKKDLSLTSSSKHLQSDVERTGAAVMQDKMTKINEQTAAGKIMARTGGRQEVMSGEEERRLQSPEEVVEKNYEIRMKGRTSSSSFSSEKTKKMEEGDQREDQLEGKDVSDQIRRVKKVPDEDRDEDPDEDPAVKGASRSRGIEEKKLPSSQRLKELKEISARRSERQQSNGQQSSDASSGSSYDESRTLTSSERRMLRLPPLPPMISRDFFSISERVTALMEVFQNIINLERELIWNPIIPSRVSRGFFLVKLFSNLLNIMPFSEVKYQEERETNEQDVTLETIVTTTFSLPLTLAAYLVVMLKSLNVTRD